jgi:hypothetical protein
MSAEHYDWLVAATRRRHRTAETPQIVFDAIEQAETDPKYAHFDELPK